MFKKLIYGRTNIAKQFIAIMLCVGMLLSMCAAFLTASAQAVDDDTGQTESETAATDDIISDGFTELTSTEADPLLDEASLSAAAIALLNREFSVLEDKPANEPPEQDPVTGDGTTIEKITIRWLSTSTGEDSPAGFGRLNLAPESDKVTNQQFQIDFSLSGQTAYEPGDIEIIFPAYLWLDRYENEPGDLTLSVPEEPETGVEFVWKRIGDNIVITNAKRLPAASKVLIQGTFRDVSAWKMKDETLSNEFNATLIVTTSEGNELSMTSNSIDAFIDTSVRVTGASKTAYDSNNKRYNVYWESVPSALPKAFLDVLDGDAEDYVYIRWYISGTASGSQPFEMTVTDTVEDMYDGVMLGATNTVDGDVASPDGKTVTATIFSGYTENYRTAYIWTAYPKEQFMEGDPVELKNTQTITVTGWDDGISTTKSASAKVDTWQPIHYKFVKIWDDNDNEMGVRPDWLWLKIYDAAYSHSIPSEQIVLTEEYADEEDNSRWIYEWSDEGQPGHNYSVDEELVNYEGDFDSRFDDEGHRLHWIYTLKSSSYDPGTHTWEYVNKYDDGWIKFEISDIKKEVEEKYQNNKTEATTDSALNELLRGNSVEIQYFIRATLSAAKPAVGYHATPNRFVLEDGTYELDNKQYSDADMNIGAVILQTPIIWKYTDYDPDTGWYDRKALTDQTVTLYGYVDNAWVAMATITTEGVLTAVPDSGASVNGRRVDLPENTAKVKTEILSGDATIVDMAYTLCLHLNPTDAMKSMVQKHLDREDYVMLPVFNKADGYVVYEGEGSVNVEGDIYKPGDHLVDVTDMDTGYVHGRQYKVAAELTKDFEVTGNDIINRSVIIHSKLTLTQQSNLTVFSEYQTAIKNGDIPNTMSGIYYDLLPAYVSPDLTTLNATNGDTIASSYIIENYKDSGRTLLVVKVNNIDHFTYTTNNTHSNYKTYPAKGYKNSHTIEFDSLVSWDIVQQYGLDYMRNVAAYEADEDWIGSVTGWEGEPDDPTAGKNIRSGNAVGSAAEYMTGLDNNREDLSFVYAGTALKYDEIDVIATTSLWKYVQVNGTGLWSDGRRNNINVEEGGSYVYQLSMKSADDTNTQDIILIDSLENYVPTKDDGADHGDAQWRGSLVSVDVSDLEAAGIKPVIYYSTVENLDVSREAMDGGKSTESEFNVLKHLLTDKDSNGNPVWSTVAPANMADVKAIAIDARKTVDGEDFILMPDESLTAYLRMKAPFEEENDSPNYFKGTDGMSHLKNAHAYNNVYLDCLQNVDGENTRDYINYSYTKVGIYTKYINVSKVWDDGDNADGYRPDSLMVHLLANGKDTGNVLVLNEENDWSGKFKRVHTYDEEGNPIVYSFSEDDFENSDRYKFTFSQTVANDGHIEVVLTNRLTPEQIDIPVTKTWDDNNNALGTRPDYVVVRLYADGIFTGRTLTLRADNAGNWSGVFTGLNKHRDGGQDIIYTIEEEYVDNYLTEVDGFTLKNTYHPMGDLIVHKTVENTTAVSADTLFSFELQLVNEDEDGSPVVNRYSYTVYDETGAVSSGEIGDGEEFTLTGGQYIVISDIPTHVLYTVTEIPSSGFTQSSVSGDTGVIKSGDNEAYFTNTYSSNGSFQLDVMKNLTGRDLMRHQFRFELTDENGDVITAYNNIDGTVSFLQIKYTEADHDKEFTYYVKEYNSNMDGFVYDDTVYTIKVYVHDNGKGTMLCDVKYYKANGEEVKDIVFNNAYKATGSLPLRLWKTIDRDITPGEFAFDLFDENLNFKSTATTDETGAVVFEELAFDENDIGNTYLYFAREQKGEDETVKYAETVLGYSVTVSDNGGGTLSFDSQAYDLTEYFGECKACGGKGDCNTCNGFGYQLKDETEEIELGNAVTPVIHNGLADGSLSVTKHVSSTNDKLPDDEFRFRIVLIGDEVKDGEFTYTVQQVDKVEFTEPDETESTDNVIIGFFKNMFASVPAPTDAEQEGEKRSGEWVNGEFEFVLHGGQQAVFSGIPAGTSYQVWEETTSGWVLVSQSNSSGVIEPLKEAKAEFTNQYQPDIATAVLMGIKYLDGKAASTDENGTAFEFVLIDQNGKAIEYADVQLGGFITFSPLVFEEEGTYTYTIREIAGTNGNIHYDDHEETVTVNVTRDSKGNLVAKVVYDNDGIIFENKTMPGSLEIAKLTDGLTDANKDAEFKFRVKFYNPNGVPITDGSFTWYVKDENGDIIGTHNADLNEISDSDNVRKISALSQLIAAAAADDEHGALYSIDSTGVVGTVRWSLYEDGTLVFEPVDGDDGILKIEGASEYSANIPWRSFSSYIKSIESTGNIHVVGSVANLFMNEYNLEDASALASWDMSQATSFYYLFYYCQKLSDFSFVSDWDTSNVTNMYYMVGSTAITDTDPFAEMDLTSATTLYGMFSGCSKLTDLSGLSGWKFSEAITEIGSMFSNCSSLVNISPLANWDMSNIRYMSYLFSYCSSLTDLTPIADWNVSKVVGMSGLFNGCTSLSDISPLLKWDTSSVTNMGYMFQNCTKLTNVDGLLKWNVSNVTNMRSMFQGCTSLNDISGLSRWRVNKVSDMQYMFASCTNLSNTDGLEGWIFNTPTNMQYMFSSSGIVNVDGLLGWDTAKPSNIVSMFQSCKKLDDLTGLANLDVSNCTSFQNLFHQCSALNRLNGLEDWDVSKVTNMSQTFRETGISDLTPLKKWNVSTVNNFMYTFAVCKSLTTLDGLEDWDINGYYVNCMFEQSWIVDASAIGSWTLHNGRSVYLYMMFSLCTKLTTLDFSEWDTSGAAVSVDKMLQGCNSVSKITFGENFWNGSLMSSLKIYPTTPSTETTTGYWINENDEFVSNPKTYTSEELVSNKVVGTYIWQYLPPYEITFDENGGSGSMSNVKNYYHLACELPENTFVKPGYVFAGWEDENGKAYNYDDNGSIVIPAKTYSAGQAVKLTAIWEPVDADGRVPYTVEHYQQSADDPDQYDLVATDVKKAKPGTRVYIEPKNYVDDGFITPDGAGWYEVPSNGYLSLQFYYDRVRYTIHFDGNGAEYGSMSDIDMVGGVAKTLPDLGFGVTSGAFLGWATEKNGGGTWYYPGQSVNNLAGDGETVTLYAQWMTIDQSVEAMAGEIIVSCKAGQTIVIQDLPAGITYEIEEIEMPAGWYYRSGTELSGTIPSNSAAYASVTNEYIAIGHATITAHKALAGASLSNEQFEFILEEAVKDVYKTASFDNDGNFTEPTASTSGATPFYLPDDTDVHFNVKYVAYYFAPTLVYLYGADSKNYSWQGTYDGKTETIAEGEAQFDWHYSETNSGSPAGVFVNIYGYDSPQGKYLTSQYYAELTYTAVIDTAYNGPVDTIEQTTGDNGKVVDNPYYGTAPVIFDTIEYTVPGEYIYYITEIDGEDDSVEYDSHTETVKVIVTDNGNGILNTEIIYEEGVEPVFTNSMKPGDLVVSKKLSNGTDVTKDVDFPFQLFLQDSNGVDLTDEYIAKKSDGTTMKVSNGDVITIKADEEFIICDLPHGCQYQIIELPRDGFTLAEAQGDTGEIIGGETSYAAFRNVYSANNELILTAKKQFIGGTISAGQFAFELVDQNYQHIETVYADENGDVVFSPIDFTEADVGSHFVYHIFEVSTDDDHIIYDTHTADIAVTVIDNADGTIGFEMDYDESELVFTNVALFDLAVSKTVSGNMGNKNETFTFSMVLSNAEYALEKYVQYSKGEETGTIPLSDDHYEFTLKHDETITFIGIPVGTEYVIVETGGERYGTSVTVTTSDDSRKVNGKQVSDTLNADTEVSYVNTIESRVPTDSTMLYGWVIAVMIMALAVFFVIRKRKRA